MPYSAQWLKVRLQEHGESAVNRLAETFERLATNKAYEGAIQDHGDLNAIFYHPHIPNEPLIEELGTEHGDYGWLIRLQDSCERIRAELDQALASPELYAKQGKRVWSASTYGNEGAGSDVPKLWKNWHLIEHGKWVMENAKLMPV